MSLPLSPPAARRALRVLAFAALAVPALAQADTAVAPQGANLRAGPAPNYPVVARLAPGTAMEVAGCTAGYRWCDVVVTGGLRGWVYAQSLAYAYQGRPVGLAQYGPTIGIPLASFAIGSYWGSHYRDRPWYGDPRYWGGRPPPPRPAPRAQPQPRFDRAPGTAPIRVAPGTVPQGGGYWTDPRGSRAPGGDWNRPPPGPQADGRPVYDRGQRAGGPPGGQGGRGMERGGGGRGPGGGEGRGHGGGGHGPGGGHGGR